MIQYGPEPVVRCGAEAVDAQLGQNTAHNIGPIFGSQYGPEPAVGCEQPSQSGNLEVAAVKVRSQYFSVAGNIHRHRWCISQRHLLQVAIVKRIESLTRNET